MLFDGSVNIKSAAVGTLVLATLYSLFKAIYNVYFHPLSKFPGPKLWAASRFPRELALLSGNVVYAAKQHHEKYGDVVRTAPDELSFTSATAMKEILTRHGSYNRPFPKDPIAYFKQPGLEHSILTVMDDTEHSRYRRLLSHAFSDKALQEQAPLIKKYIDLLILRLHENAKNGPQDMVKWFNFTTFDIIGDLSIGESFQCLEKEEYHDWVSFLFKAFKTITLMTAVRRLPWLEMVLMWFVPKSLRQASADHIAFSGQRVLKRIELGTERKDFMSNVLKHNDKETGMTIEEIIPTFGFLLLAGSETTATLLSAVTFLLLKNQEVLDKLIDEIRTMFQTEEEITQISVNKLSYQLAVIEEALRIHPPVPFGFPRVIPDNGEFVDGYWVPAGTSIWIQQYTTYHLASNFRDPESFIPERFLGDPRFRSDNKGAFIPFNIGPRNCIGVNLAYTEMRLILARLLWNFDLELEEKSRRWVDNMKVYTLWEKPPLFVKLKPVIR